jgi:hypothetical protein
MNLKGYLCHYNDENNQLTEFIFHAGNNNLVL